MSEYQMHAVVAIAGVPGRNGEVYTEEALRRAADGKRYQYDEDVKALIYNGPNLNGAVYVVPKNSSAQGVETPLEEMLDMARTANNKRITDALEVGLEAAYKIPSSGYLAGNAEERTKVGILAALRHYVDS